MGINVTEFATKIRDNVKAYRKMTPDWSGDFNDLPLLTKSNYLLSYPMEELCEDGELDKIHLIGASSGFSKTGAVYWPKRPQDEAGYMQDIETMFVTNYHIDTKKTLMIECLAFGMWIGGMQIATAYRNIALSGKYRMTLATPGLDLKTAVDVIGQYHKRYDQIIITTNPGNLPLIAALIKQNNIELPKASVYFAVVGEYFTESFREYVCELFGHPKEAYNIVWTGYGSADTGYVSQETENSIKLRKYFYKHPELSKKVFGSESTPMILECLSPDVYIEAIDGNIVVTKDQFIPLVRYNTADSGGLITEEQLKEVPQELTVPLLSNIKAGKVMYIHGRVGNAVIFYGTNLMINDIQEFLLSQPKEMEYGGLFTVSEKQTDGIAYLEFTIYIRTQNLESKRGALEPIYFSKLIDYLCDYSAEFRIKYQNLSKSVNVPLISLKVDDINNIPAGTKHKFITD